MVGIVIVSHSARLAEGVVGAGARDGRRRGADRGRPAGSTSPAALGTDAVRVMAAIERAGAAGEALVLMDLGSAVLSAETALDLLPEE